MGGGTVQEQVKSLVALREFLLAQTLEADKVVVLWEKNVFAGKPMPGGYFDIKLFALFDLGTYVADDGTMVPLRVVGEVQLMLEGMLELKKRMHIAYELSRGSFDWKPSSKKPGTPSTLSQSAEQGDIPGPDLQLELPPAGTDLLAINID